MLSEQRFAVMPGSDDVVIVGSPMLKRFGIDVPEMAAANARKGREARIVGVESSRVSDAWRVALRVAALQGADRDDVAHDEAVERLAAQVDPMRTTLVPGAGCPCRESTAAYV